MLERAAIYQIMKILLTIRRVTACFLRCFTDKRNISQGKLVRLFRSLFKLLVMNRHYLNGIFLPFARLTAMDWFLPRMILICRHVSAIKKRALLLCHCWL